MQDQHAAPPVAIVTGASRGIGRAVALGLAQDGYRVVAMARDPSRLAALVAEIDTLAAVSGSGREALIYPPIAHAIDVADEQLVCRVVRRIDEETGRIDLLFNGAGIVHRGTSALSRQDFLAMIETNLLGIFHVAKAVAPVMVRRKMGHIINVASRSGIFAKPLNGGYAATKSAVRGFSDALYQELAPHGVKVTTLCPSYVDTEQSARQTWLPEDGKIAPEDIYKTVRFLARLSPSASIKEIVIESTYVVAYGERYI